jgi:hypothetical protein
LNEDILKLTIKATGQIPKLLQIEITHYHEMNDKMFDIDTNIDINIDMNVRDNARNVIEPISFHQFHQFHGGRDSTISIDLTLASFIDEQLKVAHG